MLPNTTTRPLLQNLSRLSSVKPTYHSTARSAAIASRIHCLSSRRPRAIVPTSHRPVTVSLVRFATKPGPPFDKINPDAERKILEKEIEAVPEAVSGGSSVRHVFERSQAPAEEEKLGAIANDFKTIKDTFALTDVPRESLYIGTAGVLPYLATSLSTVYLAWDINHSKANGVGYLFSPELAHDLLNHIEPIQIGYGAVIISFLGAIHWGLEYAGYGGHQSYRRYAIGVVAPAIAWPTMMMPFEYALICQFLAFNMLYFVDARAAVRGLAPPWYATYRFVLTFVVGASIVVSLVGRGQIAEKDRSLPGPASYLKALKDQQWENLEKEEKERRKEIVEAEEKADEEEGSDEAGENDGDKDEGKNEDKDEKKDKKKDEKKDEKK
ncbi:MAG: hypothetical protein M1818_001651 [Claussenomyces sp. TS43310]|nr:MAG: hypothetical protein M1818_001651 [Claussenomyces sp. TS43310]